MNLYQRATLTKLSTKFLTQLSSNDRIDPDSRVACETMIKTGMVAVAGETRSQSKINVEEIVRKTAADIGYDNEEVGFNANDCTVINALGMQSTDIAMGVDESEAHEQGLATKV